MKTKPREIRGLIDADKLEQALALCGMVLSADPDNLEIVILKSYIQSLPDPAVSEPEAAAALLTEKIRQFPGVADLYAALGFVYDFGLGDFPAALIQYKYALRLDPSNAKTYFSLALLYGKPGVVMTAEEARDYLGTAVALDPMDWQTHRQLGNIHWELGDLELARREYEIALSSMPSPEGGDGRKLRERIAQTKAGVSFEDAYFDTIE